MKKVFISILLVLPLIGGQLHAQRGLAGQRTVGIDLGTVDGFSFKSGQKEYAFSAGLSLSKYLANQNRIIYGISYLQKDLSYRKQVIRRSQITADVGYGLRIIADRANNVVLWGNAVASAGYETNNRSGKALHDGATLLNKNCIIGGLSLGAELDVFLSDSVIFNLHLRERLMLGSDISKLHCVSGFGLKFLIR